MAPRLPVHPGYLGYRLGSGAARALPGPVVDPVVRWLGDAGAWVMAERRLIVERNVERAAGPGLSRWEKARLVRATFDSYARYWVESFRLPSTPAAALDRGFDIDGYEHIQAGLDAGSGVILALPHLGGWEWGAFWLAAIKHQPVTAVVEPVEPPELADWFLGLRARFGITAVPLGPHAGAASLGTLRDNRILCLLCDRDIGGGGVEVEFFGERTTMPAGPATLALRTGAPLLPSAVYFTDDWRLRAQGYQGHHGVVLPPVDTARRGKLREDVGRVTQELAHALEILIRRAPDQWHLMQPNWPSDHEALAERPRARPARPARRVERSARMGDAGSGGGR
ncbi:MAG: phosphatidylinositol mannoside acyltransferase [Actinobacteria bacterium]|nr:phosphatidylinositol mannoside acyltransferase [Actinomycetota bacterium]